jgi:hypothetical protein
MCLSSTTFRTKWLASEKAWVGIGYKAYDGVLDKLGRPNWSKYSKGLKPNVWMNADGNWGRGKENLAKKHTILDVAEVEGNWGYPRGFHIWLDPTTAEKYASTYNSLIAKVLYKNVLAFGSNSVNWEVVKPCIITQNMKILEVVKKIR